MNTLNAIHVYSYCVYCAQSELETMRNQYLNDMRTFMERMISQRPENAPVAGRNETGSLNSSMHPALAILPFFLFPAILHYRIHLLYFSLELHHKNISRVYRSVQESRTLSAVKVR